MSIEINDDILGIWYVAWQDTDWMAAVWKTPTGPEGKYRFRYYKNADPWGGKDEKSWYVIKPEPGTGPVGSDAEIVDALSKMAQLIAEAQRGEKWELLRGTSTLEQFTDQFRALPFCHGKTLMDKECKISMREHGTDVTVTAIHKVSGRRASATGSAARKKEVREQAIMNLAVVLYGTPPS